MSRSRANKRFLHGCWSSIANPLGGIKAGLGPAWNICPLFTCTCTCITVAQPRVQTIHRHFVRHSNTAADSKLGRSYTNYCRNEVKKFWTNSKMLYCRSLTHISLFGCRLVFLVCPPQVSEDGCYQIQFFRPITYMDPILKRLKINRSFLEV